MAKLASLKQVNRRYHAHMRNLTKGTREKDILDSLSNGKNSYLRLDRLESSSFDKSWIEEIEGVIFDLGEIINNPRQNTKVEGNIVPVELARKTSAESVQHLASHTQYVKEIDDYGNVIPSKILTMINEDDIRTYENRFIATFVRRLVLFIEKRYEFVSKFAELHDDEILYFKNKSFVDDSEVEIETKIKISHKSDDKLSLQSNAYVERIKAVRQYILYFYNSDFMHKLKTEKDVHNPILQTNIIRKNPKYHHCYEVYKFIEKYDRLGVNYKVDENYSQFTDDELKELNRTIFANYITLKGKDHSKLQKVNSKVYKPKILNSLDDESFIYGPLLSGPIEFVRTDALYQEYLDSKIKKDLPLHPTREEKEYYADEYAARDENKQDLKQKEKLIKRVEKEVKAFNKQAAKIDEEREQARLALEAEEKAIIKKEEDDLLDAARQELINASLNDAKAEEEEAKRKEQEFLDSIKPAVLPVEMSHPYSEPVTYEQAVEQIWPQTIGVSNFRPQDEVIEEIIEEEVIVEVEEETAAPIEIKEAVVSTPMSHPYTKPVTYEQAVKQIWPQLKNKPKVKKVKKAEPVVTPVIIAETTPIEPEVKEIKPAIVPVPMSHPYSNPVTYEQAVEQIWPQTIGVSSFRPEDAPIVEETPVKVRKPRTKKVAIPEPVVEEKPKVKRVRKAKPVEIKPAIVPVEMSHPYSEPVTYEQAVDQIWPQTIGVSMFRPKEEPVSEPVVKKARKPRAKKAKPAPVVEEPVVKKPRKPRVKKVAIPEPVVEEPTPVVEEPAPVVEEPAPVVKPKKARKPRAKKKAPIKKKPEPKPERVKIPGKFVVKTSSGYYVNKNKYSVYKEDAKVFDDFNLANDVKKLRGGKVVKI